MTTPPRVIEEMDELDEKIGKLDNFIASDTFAALPHGERLLLKCQRTLMDAYWRVLDQRLQLYGEQ